MILFYSESWGPHHSKYVLITLVVFNGFFVIFAGCLIYGYIV